MSIIGKGQKTDDQRFSQMHQVVEAVAQSQSEQIDRFSAAEQERQQDKAAIQKLTTELAELRQKLVSTEAISASDHLRTAAPTRSWLITDIHNESREHGKQYPPAV
jgi:dsDNA-specific endonuclease/ATPase MutS2